MEPNSQSVSPSAADADLTAENVRLRRELVRALDRWWYAMAELHRYAHFAAHDLKTPLATVANICEEVLDEFGSQIPSDARQMLETARRTVFRMSATIDELALARTTPPVLAPVESVGLDYLSRRVHSRLLPRLTQMQMGVDWPTEIGVWVRGRSIDLEEILMQVVSHALDLFAHPGRHLTTGTERWDAGWLIGVAATPICCTAEQNAGVEAALQSLAVEEDRAYHSLCLARHLAESNGGRLWFERESGQGSRFCLYFSAGEPPRSRLG